MLRREPKSAVADWMLDVEAQAEIRLGGPCFLLAKSPI